MSEGFSGKKEPEFTSLCDGEPFYSVYLKLRSEHGCNISLSFHGVTDREYPELSKVPDGRLVPEYDYGLSGKVSAETKLWNGWKGDLNFVTKEGTSVLYDFANGQKKALNEGYIGFITPSSSGNDELIIQLVLNEAYIRDLFNYWGLWDNEPTWEELSVRLDIVSDVSDHSILGKEYPIIRAYFYRF